MSLFRDGKKGCRRACPEALQTTLPPPPLSNRPEQPEEPTWQAEAPLYLSPALTHTQALLGTGPGMSRQDTIVECLPAHLPVLSTPQPHTRQGPGHISGVAKATANAHLLPASHHHHSNSHPGRPRRPECLMLSPDSSRVFPELPWLQHCTRRSHAQPFLWKTVPWMSLSSSNQEWLEECSYPPTQSFFSNTWWNATNPH